MFLAQETPTAGGVALYEILIVLAFTSVVFAALAYVLWREGSGKETVIGRLATRFAALVKAPRWFALPVPFHLLFGLMAMIGVYWDVSYHVTMGRDEGPLANPSHYPIFFGLLGMFAVGVIGCILARKDELPRRTLHLSRGWRVPYGPALVAVGGFFGFLAFPLDDIWHRLFGQDVTEWGPTHILLMGGAGITLFGMGLAAAEARQLVGRNWYVRIWEVVACLGILTLLLIYLMEYDYGISQFSLLNHPVMLAAMVALPFVLARAWIGPGGAVAVLAVFLVARVLIYGINILVGEMRPVFPLLIVELLIVELTALVVRPQRNLLAFGAVSGFLIGTVGVLAEYLMSPWWMPIPWTAQMLPWALPVAAVAATAAGVVGAWLAARYEEIGADKPPLATGSPGHRIGAAALAVLVLAVAFYVPPTADERIQGTMTIEEVQTGPERTGFVTVRLNPADAVEGGDVTWFKAFAWQGKKGVLSADMVRVGDGMYRSAEPLPIHSHWKSMLRLQKLPRELITMPVYMPEDAAIPAPEVPAASGVTRDFIQEKLVLQREQKQGVPTVLWTVAYLVVFSIFLLMFVVTGLFTARAASPYRPRPTTPSETQEGPQSGALPV